MQDAMNSGAQPAPVNARGVFILGNDQVLEFAICLFRSLRTHSPDIPVVLIPYDGHVERLTPWMQRYNIKLSDPIDYSFFDALGENLWDSPHHGHAMFRKFACFEGPFERFLYLDIDIAVLAPVERLFDEFEESGAGFMSFDNDLDNVYRRGPWRDALERSGRTKGFNAGAFLSHKHALRREQLPEWVVRAKRDRGEFVFQYDQPFFNYVVDMVGLKQVRLPEFNSAYPDKEWGDQVPIRFARDAWRLETVGHPDCHKAMPFVHWAGHSAQDPFPNRHIFYHYRLMGESMLNRFSYRFQDLVHWIIRRPLRSLQAWLRHKSHRLGVKLRQHLSLRESCNS